MTIEIDKTHKSLSGIYKITDLITQDFYIGSSKNLYSRMLSHKSFLRCNKHTNKYLQNVYNKRGAENFLFEVVEFCEVPALLEREQFYIDTMKPKYNLGPVGGGDNFSHKTPLEKDEVIRKISQASKRRWESLSEDEKLAYSESMKGDKNPNWGNRWSEELRKQASDRMKSRYLDSPEIKEIMSARMKDVWSNKTDEDLRNFSAMRKYHTTGERNPFYGKSHTEETVNILREFHINKYKTAIENGTVEDQYNCKPFYVNGVRYVTLKDCVENTGINKSCLVNRLRSKNFQDYRYEDESLNKNKYFIRYFHLEEPDGIVRCFPDKQGVANFLNVEKSSIDRFVKFGKVGPKNDRAGCKCWVSNVEIDLTSNTQRCLNLTG